MMNSVWTVKQALQRTLEVKRKATELQEDVAIQRERTRRAMNEHAEGSRQRRDRFPGEGLAGSGQGYTQPDVRCAGPREQ